jgi:hypothetical protein
MAMASSCCRREGETLGYDKAKLIYPLTSYQIFCARLSCRDVLCAICFFSVNIPLFPSPHSPRATYIFLFFFLSH